MNAKLFINYRREDARHAAGRLYDRLTAHFGEGQVFMDIDQIEPGEDFVEVINRKVGTCDIAIVVIGRRWLSAGDVSGKRRLDDEEDFVRMEIVAALERKIRVIPVLVDGAQMPGRHDLPEALAPLSRRNAIELSDTRFHADVNRLIEAIKRSLAVSEEKAEVSATPAAPRSESEAKGLSKPSAKPAEPAESKELDADAIHRAAPVSVDETTPAPPPVSSNAGLRQPKVWARKRLIMIMVIGALLILLPLAGFLMWSNHRKAAIQTSQTAIASVQKPIVPIAATPSESTQTTPVESSQATPAAPSVPLTPLTAAESYNLGRRYEQGQGVPKDLDRAVELYQRAVAQGYATAQMHLGWLYQQGLGVPKDLDKAAELYQKAADQGDAYAQNNLGWFYQHGLGVPKDLDKAAELYQKAADQGNAGAQNNLGAYYQNGEGVPKDLDKAAELYQKAADQGNADAQSNLGMLYQYGLGVPKNFDKARELLQKAADQGHAHAQSNLGHLYQIGGWDVPKDLDKARELYQKAADQGDAAGQYFLGQIYEYGFGVPKDFDKARELLQKAANQGNKAAINELDNLSK